MTSKCRLVVLDLDEKHLSLLWQPHAVTHTLPHTHSFTVLATAPSKRHTPFVLTQFAQLNQTDLPPFWGEISITRMGSNEVVTAWIINCRLGERATANGLWFSIHGRRTGNVVVFNHCHFDVKNCYLHFCVLYIPAGGSSNVNIHNRIFISIFCCYPTCLSHVDYVQWNFKDIETPTATLKIFDLSWGSQGTRSSSGISIFWQFLIQIYFFCYWKMLSNAEFKRSHWSFETAEKNRLTQKW